MTFGYQQTDAHPLSAVQKSFVLVALVVLLSLLVDLEIPRHIISDSTYPVTPSSRFLEVQDDGNDPKSVVDLKSLVVGTRGGHAADGTSKLLPACTLENVGLGRWTYEHQNAKIGHLTFHEAIVSTAEWTPLRCSLPELDWRPEVVRSCFAEKRVRNVVMMGGSTSTYIATDFLDWMKGNQNEANVHSKEREGGEVDSGLYITAIAMKMADPRASSFFNRTEFFEDTLVLFNSGLWDMRRNDLGKYAQDVGDLADAFSQYKKEHPSNHVIWRSSGTPNWDRLDIQKGRARARERLMNPDAVLVYNAVASESMQSRGIEVFDNTAMVLGRPDETRGPDDGLHPSTHLNVELMKILLSVFCQE